jgi:hypothetical protein
MPDSAVTRSTAGPVLPALIAGAGDRATLRFLEFLIVNIRNRNTRAAYGRAAARAGASVGPDPRVRIAERKGGYIRPFFLTR